MLLFGAGGPLTLTGSCSRTYCPGWLCPDDPRLRSLRRCGEFASLWEFCLERRPRSVALLRQHALGDIVMLLPLARLMHRVLGLIEPVRVIVNGRYLVGLRRLRDPRLRLVRSSGVRDYGAQVHLDLNGALEADHRGGPESDQHRMMLYARAIGMPL